MDKDRIRNKTIKNRILIFKLKIKKVVETP